MKFAQEKLADVWDDFHRLASLHWKETELYRHEQVMAPDKDSYIHYNNIGFHILYTARDDNDFMCGYCGMYVRNSMHTQKPVASEDTFYLMPEYRRGRNAMRFYQFVENDLFKNKNVTEITQTTKHAAKNAARLLDFLGYENIGYVFAKQCKENM